MKHSTTTTTKKAKDEIALGIAAAMFIGAARCAIARGCCFGDKVPLGAIADLDNPEECALLVKLHQLGKIVLVRADLPTAWSRVVDAVDPVVMARSELKIENATFHGILMQGSK